MLKLVIPISILEYINFICIYAYIYLYACTFSDVYQSIYVSVDICAYEYVLIQSQIFKTLLLTADKITFKVTYHKVRD